MYYEILHRYLAVCLHLIPDDLEPFELKVIKIWQQIFRKWCSYNHGVEQQTNQQIVTFRTVFGHNLRVSTKLRHNQLLKVFDF